MRKHFLILMLLTLLPFTAWAEEPVDLPSDFAVTFTPDNAKYNGAVQAVEINTATATVNETPGTSVKTEVEIKGVYSDLACTNPATVKNAGTYYVKVGGRTGGDYKTTSYKVFTFTIAKFGTITVSASACAKDYGQAYTTVTDYYVATMPTGATETLAQAGLVVTPSFNDWDVKKLPGVYPFTISAETLANYNVAIEDNTSNLTINKANLNVAAKNKTMKYGEAQPTYEVTYGSNLVEGDDADFGPVAYTVKNGENKTFVEAKGVVGDYTITPSLAASDKYNFVYGTGTLTVTARAISNVAFVMAGSTYSGDNELANLKKFKTLTDAGVVAPAEGPKADDFTVEIFAAATGGSTGLTTADQAGKYYAQITAAADKNYTGAAAARVEVVLDKKQLNIISKDASYDYDGNSPALTFANVTFNGLAAGDATSDQPKVETYDVETPYENIAAALAAEFNLSLSTLNAKNAGTYTINVSSKQNKLPTAIFKNYKVNYVNVGEMTINKVQVTLKPADAIIQYGDQEPDWANVDKDAFEIKFYKKSNNADITPGTLTDEILETVFSTMPDIERVVPTGKTAGDVGTYDLNAINYVVKADGNYELKAGEPKKGTLTIQPSTSITILVDNVNAVYGEFADQAALEAAEKLTYRVSGMKAADKSLVTVALSVVDGDSKPFAGKRGTYTIKIGDVTLDPSIEANYAGVPITRMDGTLTVGKAPLTLKVLDQALIADDTHGEALAPASEQTVEILTEGLSDADKTALFTTGATKISLKYSNKLVSGDDYVAGTGVLKSAALTHGWNGTAALGNGIYVNGIEIDAASYNADLADVNYYLDLEGEDATVTPGKLTLTAPAAELVLDVTTTDGTVKTAIDAADGKKVNVVVKNRTFKKDTWAVLVLPFETTVRQISNALGYAVVDVLDTSKGTGDYVYFKLTTGKINANQPFMVKTDETLAPDAVTKVTKTFTGKVIVKSGDVTTPTADDIDAGGTQFIGVWKQQQVQGDKQLWYNDVTGWSYNKNGKSANVNPTLAYLQLPETASGDARIFIEEPDGSTTAITAIAADGTAIEATGWYTLNGVRLQGAPVEKGVYINNGKKVVIK